MKEMKTQLILFSLLLLGSTAWAQQPCLSQDAYREKVEAYSQILKQQKLKTLASSEARKIAHTGFLPKIDVNADGTLNKELKEICLLDQAYVQDSDLTVAKYVEKVAKENNANVTVKRFVRFETGEGIEKKQEDFAAEVAAQMNA